MSQLEDSILTDERDARVAELQRRRRDIDAELTELGFPTTRNKIDTLSHELTAQKNTVAEQGQLLHELQVAHTELDTQNEELRTTEEHLLIAHDRYQDLYDFAPVGYFTVDAEWKILQANLTGANLLSIERQKLLHQPLTHFIAPGSQDDFHFFRVQSPQHATTLELQLIKEDGVTFWAHFDIIAAQQPTGYRLAVSDITECKRAEALRESEERFRTMANALPQLAWIAQADGYIIWYNQRWYEYTGTTPDQMEGWGWQRVHDSTTLSAVLEKWKASIATGQPFEMEFPLRGADGHFRTFLTRGHPLKDAGGEVVQWLGTNTDITERKRAENVLRESAEELATVLEVAPVAIWISHDAQCHAITGNRLANEFYQAEPGENVSANITPVRRFFRDGLELTADELPMQVAARENRDVRNVELDVLLPSGAWNYMQGSASPLRDSDGNVRGCVGTFMDINMRKQAEEALRESEERYHTLFDGMTEGFALHELVLDDQGNPVDYRFLDINPAFEKLTGLKREDVINYTLNEVLPGDDPKWLEMYSRVALTGEPLQLENYSPALQRHYDVLAYRPAPLQFAVIFMDVTERKHAEEALQASLHEKEVLLKEIHHRVKNNMQVISSLVNLQADTLDNPELSPLFNNLRDQIRCMALVHEKLYQSESLAHVEFAEYTESLLNYLWRAHGEITSNVRLKLELQPVTLSVEQAVPCGLVLNELVTNALKHAFHNGTQGELQVTLHGTEDGKVTLRVSDNGPGLPAGLDWRNSSSLGLRLVQMLAGQLRATLDVTSENGLTVEVVFRR